MTDKWHYASTLAGNPNGRTHYDIGGDDCSNVAIVYPSEDGDEDTLRKARLIAAAPDLLAALKNVKRILESRAFRAVEDSARIHGVEYQGEGFTQPDMDNAIRKAEGEPTHNSPPVLGGEFRRRLG